MFPDMMLQTLSQSQKKLLKKSNFCKISFDLNTPIYFLDFLRKYEGNRGYYYFTFARKTKWSKKKNNVRLNKDRETDKV